MKESARAPYFDGTQPCAQVGGDFFFPEGHGDLKANKPFLDSLCNSCEFTTACLLYAVTHNVEGFWAGTMPRERRIIRQRNKLSMIPYSYSRIHDEKVINADDQ